MAIDRRKDDEFRALGTATKNKDEEEEEEGRMEVAPRVTCSRSQEAAVVCAPPEISRPVVFTREHTFLRRVSTKLTCPNCLRCVDTSVERLNTRTTYLSALLLFPVCLCMLPYFSKTLRETRHRCPECGVLLGAKFASAHEALAVALQRNTGDHTDLASNSDAYEDVF